MTEVGLKDVPTLGDSWLREYATSSSLAQGLLDTQPDYMRLGHFWNH